MLGKLLVASWTTKISPEERGFYFGSSITPIDQQLLVALKQQAKLLSTVAYQYFGNGNVIVDFQGWERGVLTRENWCYTNGQEEDIWVQKEPHRPRVGCYEAPRI